MKPSSLTSPQIEMQNSRIIAPQSIPILRLFLALLLLYLGALDCLAQTDPAPASATLKAVMPTKHAAVFQKYCYDCHNAEDREGSVDLEGIDFTVSANIETAERWAKVLNAINSGEMPPPESDPISAEDKMGFLEDLSQSMVLARKILSDSGGVVTMRRLNRREYQNAIEHLLGVRPDVSTLPDDQATAGFDTAGASLFFSSDQLEQYLTLARHSLKLAINPPKMQSSATVRIEPEEQFTPYFTGLVADWQDALDRAKEWQAQSNSKSAKPPSAFGFLDEFEVKNKLSSMAQWLPQVQEYVARPETKTGVTMILTIKGFTKKKIGGRDRGKSVKTSGGMTRIKLPRCGAKQHGRYTIRIRAAAYKDAPERMQYLELTSGGNSTRKHLGWRKVNGTLDKPEVIEFSFDHLPGQQTLYAIHQRTHQDRGDKNIWTADMRKNGLGTPPGVWIDWVEMTGPEPLEPTALAAEARPVLFEREKGWSNRQYAAEVIKRFATRAFRGKQPNEEYLVKLLDHYDKSVKNGDGPKVALLNPLSIILASPSFLYLVEASGEEKSAEVSGLEVSGLEVSGPELSGSELAVRLSQFLWSAPPDDQLLAVAASGELLSPDVLKQQTARLLADERADEFVRGFVHQWLQMERLDMFQFDGLRYPTFDNAVRASAREEIYQTVHWMIKERLPLHVLLKSNFVVVNDVMADYYGIDGVRGSEFRKVEVPENSLRGGLLGTAAVLAMGSDGLRSSPVERGVWVLRHLINDPPPPAPPNVPQLSRLDGKALPARELQNAHQELPQCAQCHRNIDPIGYALENFDAAGLWRDVETVSVGRRRKKKQFPIDTRGSLPSGKKFADYFELRDAVADHRDDFARGLTESLIAYGLGRPYGFTDQDLSDEILKRSKESNYEIAQLIHSLVQSKAFKAK